MAATKVGEVESLAIPNPDGTFELRSRMRFQMHDRSGLLPDPTIRLAAKTEVDRDFQMRRYDLRGMMSGVKFSMQAERKGDRMRLAVDFLLFRKTMEDLPFEEDTVLSDGFMPYFGGRLGVGKKWKVKTLDVKKLGGGAAPDAFGASDLFATVEERKRVSFQGRDVTAYEVVVRKGPTPTDPISHVVLVDEAGTVLVTTLYLGEFVYEIRLEEKRSLSPEEARNWKWGVALPSGLEPP
jgi:hypothetical protein